MGYWDEPAVSRGVANRGWLWMDVDITGDETEDVSYWPGDGAGSVSATANSQRPVEVAGFSLIILNGTADADVIIKAHDGTTSVFTIISAFDGSPLVGNFFSIFSAGKAAHNGANAGNNAGAGAPTRGVTMDGFSVQVADNSTNTGAYRIWYRYE